VAAAASAARQQVSGAQEQVATAVRVTTEFLIGHLIPATVVLMLFIALARVLSRVVGGMLARRTMRSDAALLLTRSIFVGVVSIGTVIFIAILLGQALVGVTGVLVAAVLTSFGLQDLFKSYVSGFYVLMEKNVRVGDLIQTDTQRGVVTDIRMRVTYLRGAAGEVIVVPNSELFTKTLVVSEPPPDWGSASKGAQHDPVEGVKIGAR
jgi:small-conductance mechanosensitive channel